MVVRVEIDEMAEELRDFLKRQPHERVDSDLHKTLLETAQRGWPDRSFGRVSDVQPVFDEAIAAISNDVSRRAADALFGDGDRRYLSVKSRGTEAGAVHGVSYDAYRRSSSGRMTGDLVLLADAIAGRADANTAAATQDSEVPARDSGPARSKRALLLVGAAVLVVSAGALTVRAMRSDEPVAESAVEENVSTTTEATTITTDAANTTAITEVASSAPSTTSGASSTQGSIRQRNDLLGSMSVGSINSSDAESLRAAAAISESGVVDDDDSGEACAVEPVSKKGEVFWQLLERDGRLDGGVVAYESIDGDGFEVIRLNAGQWQSYIRIGGGDGSRSTILGGVPSGELTQRAGLYQLELLGDAVLVGADPEGTYYWMPNIANAEWEADLASDAPRMGLPTTSLYLSEGEFRVDFENGYMFQTTNAVISFEEVPESERVLDAPSLVGGLISSIDGTAWFVDGEGKRWWIPDGRVWECVGGGNNLLLERLRGYQIHSLEYGGVASCPMGSSDVWPKEGGLNLRLYCLDEFEGAQISDDTGWRCQGLDGEMHEVAVEDACRWQYGPDAISSLEPGNPQSWYCENVDS